jgi:MarR family transcriptional regulator, organic hydroperoxide resistance regulator
MADLLALFTQAAKLLREAADGAMSPYGVRVGQHIVLSVLWEEDGLTPGEIARRLGVATPTIVNTATRMEEAGLLVRRPDPDDARLVRLYLTPHARAVRESVRDARSGLERRATATLTPAELDHLASALTKIIARLQDGRTGGLSGLAGRCRAGADLQLAAGHVDAPGAWRPAWPRSPEPERASQAEGSRGPRYRGEQPIRAARLASAWGRTR